MTNREVSPTNAAAAKTLVSQTVHHYLVAGRQELSGDVITLTSPWDDADSVRVAQSSLADVDASLAAAVECRRTLADTTRADRAAVLAGLADLLTAHSDEFAELLVSEVGKTDSDARGEIDRTVSTLRFAAEAAKSLVGDILPLDAMPSARGKFGYTLLEPIGVVVGIPAANFPLLISAHKIAPAVGAGCPLVLKAPDRTPRVVVRFAELLVAAGWDPAGISVLTGGPEIGDALVRDPRPRLISFTGSSAVGKIIADRAGFKRTLLELGSNAATIVTDSADVEHAARRIAAGGFAAAGQSCISVQRVYVHRSRRDELEERLVGLVGSLRVGSASMRDADIGPLLTEAAAERVEAIVNDARASGAAVIIGGGRSGRFVEPTIVTDVTPEMRLHREEVFGPVVAIVTYDTFDEAIALANDSDYGLQAGIFTDSAAEAQRAARHLDVGGVHINEVSMWRADHMPYGGVKDSGFGKEGPAWAMREMTVAKVVSWAS